MMWFIGQRVACIDDQLIDGSGKIPAWTRGEVYTIKEIRVREHMTLFLFNEARWINPWGEDIWAPDWRFRPVVETSIAVFEKMLRRIDRHADA